MTLTFGSLFAGIGGIDLGLERAGMQCAWQVEIDDYAQKVLAKHWPHVARFRDVRDCGSHNLAPVDLIAGGFPCQDISYAGRGAGLAGARSGLWYEYARIISELRPRYVLVENVAALLTRGIGDVLGSLASFGYDAEWHCIPAAYIGAPHRRDRLFIVAHTTSNGREENEGLSVTPQQLRRIVLPHQGNAIGDPWSVDQPSSVGMANGVPFRVDRLRGSGNAVVPQIAELLGRAIVEYDARLQ